MDFTLPPELAEFLEKVDDFIEREIKPMEQEADNIRFLDHRREDARTDWDRGGLPNKEWEDLMREARKKADAAGLYRYSYPSRLGGMDGTNLGMAVIREHLATKGLGLHCDLQTEHTIVGIAGGSLPVSFFGIANEAAVATTYWGSLPELMEVISLASTGRIRAHVQRFSLVDAVLAYETLHKGGLAGRAVIVPG